MIKVLVKTVKDLYQLKQYRQFLAICGVGSVVFVLILVFLEGVPVNKAIRDVSIGVFGGAVVFPIVLFGLAHMMMIKQLEERIDDLLKTIVTGYPAIFRYTLEDARAYLKDAPERYEEIWDKVSDVGVWMFIEEGVQLFGSENGAG